MAHRLSRRSFLTDVGGGTIAVAIFGLAGCGGSGSGSAGSGSADSGSAGSGSAGSGSAASETTSGEGTSTSRAAATPGTLAWERVNLGFVSAYVVARGSELAVVDTGTKGSEGEILNAIEVLGGNWDNVGHVILTHAHGDHVGSVSEVMANAAGATAYAGTADVPKVTAPRDVVAVDDGDEVFGLQIIGTPGHTPGHISVFDEDSGLLFAGDAMNGENGGIIGANPGFTADMVTADESIRRLSTRTIDTVLFGHGEPVLEDAGRALEELAASLS